jgi:hypothetical protein
VHRPGRCIHDRPHGLTLRYRVAAHDGAADVAALDAIATDFRN